ncbi:MAG: hypothetical protein M3Z84_01235 [Actinomycetota bacterium]|nr:hypothetical protein [Actinomycetota bacterium]
MSRPQNASGSAGVIPLLLGVHWHDDFAGGLDRYVADLLASLRRAGLSPAPRSWARRRRRRSAFQLELMSDGR